MTDFTVFLQGVQNNDEVMYEASQKFKDEKGKVVQWKLKAIDSALDEAIRKDCTKKVRGGRGVSNVEVDTDKYTAMLCVNTVVYPNLNDAAFQDALGVKSAEALLRKLLLPGELMSLKEKVMEVNGFDMSMEDLIDEAKN